ncbi:hypothetical protein GGR56DRAFT_678223 [Xylariaceae sp. FL0804]|nr:hypothetical protein GGR56DRAFT_678223 [Xylariaceae sp. FL0804]
MRLPALSIALGLLYAAGLATGAQPSSAEQARRARAVLPRLKRDTSGGGFAHVGSDGVVRTFDATLGVVDFAFLPTDDDLSFSSSSSSSSSTMNLRRRTRSGTESESESEEAEAAPAHEGWPRDPGPAILDEVRRARARSADAAAAEKNRRRSSAGGAGRIPRDPGSGSRLLLAGRQALDCVSEFCPDDEDCRALRIYGYNCTSCLLVTEEIGNCQSF